MWLITLSENSWKFASPSRPNPVLYSRTFMTRFYDPLVVHASHRVLWGVSNRVMRRNYAEHTGERHLDVGPGTGYFLRTLPKDTPLRELHLLDLNPESLNRSVERIGDRFGTPILHGDVDALAAKEPWPLKDGSVDSVGSNMMIHCLPRANILDKAEVFAQAARVLRTGGRFFGATILAEGTRPNGLARRFLTKYNSLDNSFFNTHDNPEDLRTVLSEVFDPATVRVDVHGCTGVFSATAR